MILRDERNHWPRGLVRHLRIDDECSRTSGVAMRVEHDGGLKAGGSVDILYTLVLHPCNEHLAETVRQSLEASDQIGGPFSPERDDA